MSLPLIAPTPARTSIQPPAHTPPPTHHPTLHTPHRTPWNPTHHPTLHTPPHTPHRTPWNPTHLGEGTGAAITWDVPARRHDPAGSGRPKCGQWQGRNVVCGGTPQTPSQDHGWKYVDTRTRRNKNPVASKLHTPHTRTPAHSHTHQSPTYTPHIAAHTATHTD
jgi:hypothetical protein